MPVRKPFLTFMTCTDADHLKISDLLASISGGEPSADTPPPKRKAEDDLKSASKLARKGPAQSQPTRPSRPLDRPNAPSRPTNGQSAKPATSALKPTNDAYRVTKPAAPVRPSPAASSSGPPAVSRATPKRGSYAEILARAKQAQQTMGRVGQIQHKKVEKKEKEKEPIVKPDSRTPTKKPTGSSVYQGTAKPGQRLGMNGAGTKNGSAARDARGKPTGKTPTGEPDRMVAQEEPEKKFKKAAQATTGYTGTARPRPGVTTKKDSTHRGGALLNRAPPRPGGSKSSRYEDAYDEDMDDFIEYDDEDGQGGPRYHYDSDGSSDMEAGLDDIDVEERKAERIARLEDIQEERLERSLKAAKEERRRKALEELRAKKR